MRSKELSLHLLEVLAQPPSLSPGPSLVPILESANLACPECGVYYVTKEGLQMHIQHRHPHLNSQARLSFRRDVHSLFGLPICRFCKARLHDWKSLTRHITTGTCLRIKEFCAAGLSEGEMLQRIEEEERTSPPEPPTGASRDDDVHVQLEAALCLSNNQLVNGGAELLVLAKHCALCKQIIKEAGKIRSHWKASHAIEFDIVKTSAESGAKSLVSAFTKPCRFCGSQAKNVRDHAVKCAALFQLLAVRHLRSRGTLSPAPSCGPSLKQRARPPQYQLYARADTPLGRAFGLRDDSRSQPKVSAQTSVGAAPSVKASVFPPPGLRVGEAPRLDGPWLTLLQLRNPQNVCFMNATVFALLHSSQGADWQGRALRGLRDLSMQAVASGTPLTLSAQLLVRSLLPVWVFDGRQHDAAEFALAFLGGLGLTFGMWETRRLAGEQIDVLEQGQQPLGLEIHGRTPALEGLIARWHRQDSTRALVDVPEVLVLQLARYRAGRKLHNRVVIPRLVRVPVFTDGMQTRWALFRLMAVVEHIGNSLDCGHYRAVLRIGTQWWHTDDSCAAIPVEWSIEFERRAYLLWLVPAQPQQD